MSTISKAKAYSNGEVGYISWQVGSMIHGCLGFEITRIYSDDETQNAILPAWVPFNGQSNPDWKPQNTSVWPIQKLNWRDLTLIKNRDSLGTHDQGVKVKYLIKALVPYNTSLTEVVVNIAPDYKGTPIKMSYVDEGIMTNEIIVGTQYGKIRTTFTNGIISTQYLTRALDKINKDHKKALQDQINIPGSDIRKYLTGQVLTTLLMLLDKAKNNPNATLRMAIYELSDNQLIDAIIALGNRVEIILSNTSKNAAGEWDDENAKPRADLKHAGVIVHDRYFNNGHIGHNKFVLYLENNIPQMVMMGSTNWTPTGLCTQSNNSSIIDSEEVSALYNDYWEALKADTALFVTPDPPSAKSNNVQGSVFRLSNSKPNQVITLADQTEITVWFSPNTLKKTVDKTTVPPDISDMYSLMRKAEKAIFFAVFLPGRSNDMSGSVMTNIITEAISIGQNDNSMMVYGAISDPTAMPNYVNPPRKTKDDDDGDDDTDKPEKMETPTTYDKNNVHIVRAFNLREEDIIGDFEAEMYSAGHAIIHDKVMVIDPFSENAAVMFGSHNFGFKASYENDENLVIVRNNPALVQAFAVHILDIYEHYRFRAVQKELHDEGKPEFDGFLSKSDSWLENAMQTTGKGDLSDYMCS